MKEKKNNVMFTHTHTHAHAPAHLCMHACMHAHAHTHTHTHTRTNSKLVICFGIYYLPFLASRLYGLLVCLQEGSGPLTARDKHFTGYTSSCIFTNARQTVHSMGVWVEETIPPPCPPPTSNTSRGEEAMSATAGTTQKITGAPPPPK